MRDDPITPNRRSVLLGGIGAISLLAIARAQATNAGEVVQIRGSASAAAGDQNRVLTEFAPVYIGDLVKTEAAARLGLKLGERTHLSLGELSKIKIDRYIADAGGEIELIDGAIKFEREGPKAGEDLTFRSTYGLIAVRGTRFYAGPSAGAFGILVGTGRVEVTAAGKSVSVGAGQGTSIPAPGQPPTEPSQWKIARIRELQRKFN